MEVFSSLLKNTINFCKNLIGSKIASTNMFEKGKCAKERRCK
jgi:hypothetical protein